MDPMKASSIPFAILGLAITCSSLAQQPPAPAKPARADPFVRDGVAAAPAGNVEKDAPVMLYSLIEYFDVPRDAWLAYSAANPLRVDATELRAEVQSWVKAGKARPLEITCVPAMSNERMVVESIIEQRYAIEFENAEPTPVPTTFETRNSHFTYEWEPVFERETGAVQIQLTPQITRFAGHSPELPALNAIQPNPPQPKFTNVKPSLNARLHPAETRLLQVATQHGDDGTRRQDMCTLSFLRVAPRAATQFGKPVEPLLEFTENERAIRMPKSQWDALQADENAKPRARAIQAQIDAKRASFQRGPFVAEVERLSVNLADLNEWFAGKPLDVGAAGLHSAAREWIGAGRAKDIDRVGVQFREGMRAVSEDVFEYRFPIEYFIADSAPSLPKDVGPQSYADHILSQTLNRLIARGPSKDPIVTPATFETRNTGYMIELEGRVIDPWRTMRLQLAVTDVRLCGNVVVHRREVNSQLIPDQEQPIFGTMKTSTRITLGLDQPTLLAIHTPVNEAIKPHPDQRILTFITLRN